MKPRVIFIITLGIVVISTVIAYQALSHSKRPKAASQTSEFSSGNSENPVNIYSSTPSSLPSSSPLTNGEQLSKPPQRRPVQYLHVCQENSSGMIYVTQGDPKCLPEGTFQRDYDQSVPGTAYSTPCQTTGSSSLRYVYISSTDSCPVGTTASLAD